MEIEKPSHIAYSFNRFTLDLGRGALLALDGTELPLRPKSFALLIFFVENAGRLLNRDAIMDAVWPGVTVSDDSITRCVSDIRRAFGDDAQRLLRTVQRRGYRFTAAVTHAGATSPLVLAGNGAGAGDEPKGLSIPANGVPLDPTGQQSARRSNPEKQLSKYPPGPEQTEPVRPPPASAAERRHLTVLFCDLVDSTELSEKLDPEDFGSIISIYREHCAAAIVQAGGHIESYTGDGIVAFFGYPQAREDAAERSVRAGLAIVEAAQHLHAGLALQVRIGIATGLVVNDPTSQTLEGRISVGQPLHLAARLLAIAEPATVVIAESTRRLVGSLFALEDLGARPLKGFAAAMRAWRVTGEGVAESRFRALRGTDLIPLVGREHELTMLLDRWEQASDGDGQVVLVVGEPGIGKSRLVQALRDRLIATTHIYVGCYCSAHRMDSPLQPVIAHLKRAANFTGGDSSEQMMVKLNTLLAQSNEDITRLAPLLASLLSVTNDNLFPPCGVTPQLQRERTLAALVDQLARLSSQRPVLLVCEDVHWADQTSLELLRLAIDRLQNLPVLALITFRPGFAPSWAAHTHVTGLTLNRLSRQRCGQMVAGLTGGKSLPAAVLEQIEAKAEGIPLFVEELTKQVLESGLLREEHERYELAGPLQRTAIPLTLQDSLMARLDNLASAKEIAQVGAAIGREFAHDLLNAVIPEHDGLAESLQRLIATELVFRRGIDPHVTYVFKHALIRDVAYASLLTGKRRQLHTRIAQVLEEQFPQVAEADPDVLARHWAEAGVRENAVNYRLKAGERALAQSATTEAVAQLTMGQELLQGLPDGENRHRKELGLQIALGAALSAAKGMAAPETAKAYGRARELCGKLNEEQHLIPVLLGLWTSHNARDELTAARAAAAQLLQLADQRNDHVASILGHRTLGATLFGLGEFTGARTHLQKLLTLDCSVARRSAFPLPYDPGVSGRAWLALTLAALGYPEQAIAESDKALDEARPLQHHNTLALVICLRCSVAQFLRDHHDVSKHAEALLAIAATQNFAYWAGFATYFRGWAQASAGEFSAGIGEMRRGLAACESTGAQAYVPYNLALTADMCRRGNDPLQGRQLLDEALDRLGQTDARYCESELLCIDGDLRLIVSPADKAGAEVSFRRAIEVSARQHAKVFELRASVGLARLWADAGRRRQAHDLLASVYGWFTEGFKTQRLVEARLLIAALE